LEVDLTDWRSVLVGLDVEEVRPLSHPVAENPRRLIEEALLKAEFVPFLEHAVRSKTPLTILLNDADRFTDSRSALEAVLQVARDQGLEPRFRILFACGSHIYSAEQKRRHEERVLPEEMTRSADLSWHDSRDPGLVLPIGPTHLHHWVVEGDCHLVVGSMEPHYFAGITGAHKTLTVGVMSYDSLRLNHERALSSEASGLKLEGNPVYEGIAAVVNSLQAKGKRIFAVNETLAGGGLVACTAGDPLDSLGRGFNTMSLLFSRKVSRPVDLIVARVRPPLDKSLYQADKGIKNVEAAVRDRGVILLEAPCEEGVGLDRFFRLMERAPTHSMTLELVEKDGYELGDHKAVRLRALTERRGVRLGIVSSRLSDVEAGTVGLEPFDGAPEAARWAIDRVGQSGGSALIVEDAGNMTITL
jgi:nickel-dependent lactate racemase